MIPAPAKRPAPPRRRAWLLVALVFIVQLGLIFGLGGYTPVQPRQAVPAPKLRLAGPAAFEWLALNDPTLFALPHAEGFSGLAWLHQRWNPPPARDWSEPPRLLSLPVAQLGAAFGRLAQSSDLGAFATPAQAPPELTLPELPPETLRPGPSSFRLEGDLARRRLLTPLPLPPWPYPDLLANSDVQLVVDALGRPTSVTLLSGSGSKDADDHALKLAAAARFNPLHDHEPGSANPAAELTWGRIIFQWQTVPQPLTNSAPAGP